jgi:hypothetical protein
MSKKIMTRNHKKSFRVVVMEKIKRLVVLTNLFIILVPGMGNEPAQPQVPRDFKTQLT